MFLGLLTHRVWPADWTFQICGYSSPPPHPHRAVLTRKCKHMAEHLLVNLPPVWELRGTWLLVSGVANTDALFLCEATTSPRACTHLRGTISTSSLRTSGEGTSPSLVTVVRHSLTYSEVGISRSPECQDSQGQSPCSVEEF